MTDKNKKSFSEHMTTRAFGYLTLVVTVIALIPAFLSLNDEEALVYYSFSTSHVSIPGSLDSELALSALEREGIPGSTVELSVINQGNIGAEDIKFDISAPRELLATWSDPSVESNPIWATIPDISFQAKETKLVSAIPELAATKPIKVYVGYKYEPNLEPSVTVFYSGRPGILVQDISTVPEWSKWNVFWLPLYVFIGCIGFILLWSFISALIQNPSFRETLLDELLDATHIGIGPIQVTKIIKDAIKKDRENRDGKP